MIGLHLKRWITSIIAVPLLLLLIFKGGPLLFAIFIGVVCLFTLWEYFNIVFHPKGLDKQDFIPILGFVIGPGMIWAAYGNSFRIVLGLISFNLIIAGIISLLDFKKDSTAPENVAKQILGIIYIPLLLSYLVMIRNAASGIIWICFLLCIVFVGDIGAFYVGSYLGRHKLCPAVSPKKTIEGSIGGLVANLGAGALFKSFFLPALSWGMSILFFLSLGIAGQVGDLFESEYKRSADIKDSGIIVPGHGGILDRIDALLFAAPVAYFFKEFIL